MKVNRYITGRSNISELQSQKAGLVPGQVMAEAAAAPYNAVAQVANQVTSDIARIDARDKQLLAEEDAIAEKLSYEQLKLDQTELVNDPAYDNQIHESGADRDRGTEGRQDSPQRTGRAR